MDLSHGYFYKTVEEAETAIKQYFKEHYFISVNRPWRIKKILLVRNFPRRIKEFVFVGNRPQQITIILFVEIPDE